MSSTERRPPFTWSAEDRAKLVPGAKVTRYFSNGITAESVEVVFAGDGFVRFVDEYGSLYDSPISTFDPATIEPPRRDPSALEVALKVKIAEWRLIRDDGHEMKPRRGPDCADEIEAILKEHGSHG